MELIPKLFVAGISMGPPAQEDAVNRQRLNQIWADVAGKYDNYVQLQVAPDGSGARFSGATSDEEGVTIQPPVIQVSDAVRLTPEQSADKASDIFKIAARHLLAAQFFNLGVRHIYHFSPHGTDAPTFMQAVFGKDDDDLAELGHDVVPGVKYYVRQPGDGEIWTIQIEPLLADPEARTIIVDVDAQFGGLIQLDNVVQKCRDAREYVETGVQRYIDRASGY